MKKALALLLLLGIGVAVGVFGYDRWLERQHAAATSALRLYGNVELRDAQLAFYGQERIATLLVEEGDRVAPDQLLATLRTERLQAEVVATEARVRAQQALVDKLNAGARPEEVEQARAMLVVAEVQVANAESLIARVRATTASGAASAQDLDNASSGLDVAKAEQQVRQQGLALVLAGPRAEDKAQAGALLDGTRAELALLQRRLADSELRAPQQGVIQSRILEVGEMASPERAVFTLALTDPKWIRAFVPEPDLGRIRAGMRATMRSDSFGGRSYEGWVGFVSPVAEFTPKAVETAELRTKLVYEVRVYVRDPNGELPLGMPVTIDIDTEGGVDHAPKDGK